MHQGTDFWDFFFWVDEERGYCARRDCVQRNWRLCIYIYTKTASLLSSDIPTILMPQHTPTTTASLLSPDIPTILMPQHTPTTTASLLSPDIPTMLMPQHTPTTTASLLSPDISTMLMPQHTPTTTASLLSPDIPTILKLYQRNWRLCIYIYMYIYCLLYSKCTRALTSEKLWIKKKRTRTLSQTWLCTALPLARAGMQGCGSLPWSSLMRYRSVLVVV
jgi:hypothetical protein